MNIIVHSLTRKTFMNLNLPSDLPVVSLGSQISNTLLTKIFKYSTVSKTCIVATGNLMRNVYNDALK